MQDKTLATEDPDDFKSRRVNIRKNQKGLDINIIEPEMSFKKMMKLRTVHDCANQAVLDGINSSKGYTFANLGLSVVLTMTYKDRDYLLLVKQRRPDLKDYVAKLVSGFVDSKYLKEPFLAVKQEVSEEILPVLPDGEIIRFWCYGEYFPYSYCMRFSSYPKAISLMNPARFSLPDLENSPIYINGEKIKHEPQIYFQIPTNSAQLVYSYHLNTEDIDFKNLSISLHHSEDVLVKGSNTLEKRLHPYGMLLLELKDDDLTDKVYQMINGILIPINPEIVLSEAFAQKSNGAVDRINVPLRGYLYMKK